MLYARVAPHARLPVEKDELSYAVTPETLALARVGQMVTVSVRGRKTWGIITGLSQRRPSGVRQISPISSVLPIRLSNEFLAFARTIQAETRQPLGICLASMLPPPKKRFPASEDVVLEPIPALTGAQTIAVTGDPRHRYAQYDALAKKSLANGRSVILVFAHHAELDAFIDQSNEPVIRWESEVSVGRRWQTWQRIQKGQGVVVAGLRTAIFAPVNALGLIIIDSPLSRGHKGDQAPYLTSLTAARFRQVAEPCHLVLGDTLPPLSTHGTQELRSGSKVAPIDLVAAESHFTSGLQAMSEAWLTEHVKPADRCFVLLNRLGAGHYRCADCQMFVRCPQCQSALLLERSMLHCQQCGWHGAPPAACPTCNSVNLSARGIGTETVAEALSMLLNRPAAIVDRYHPEWPGSQASLIIGTELALPFLISTPPDWSLILGIDGARRHPSFDAGERAVRLVADIAAVTLHRVAIETTEPEDPWSSALHRHAFTQLLNDELQDRIKSKYPPARALIAFRGTNDTLEPLRQALSDRGITVFGPVLRRDGKTAQLLAKLPVAPSHARLLLELERDGLLKQVTTELDPPSDSFN